MDAPSSPDVRLVEAASILTRTGGFLHSYTHTVNPYAGCAFGGRGCGVYCYAAESPMGRFGRAAWGQWVDAKANAAELLEQQLSRTRRPPALRIFMSSTTDPYQPAEARLKITRMILSVFCRHPVGLLAVQTRSPLVERDFDLLEMMPFVWLSMTVETDDDAARRALTPVCPSIDRRLATMRRARERGIKVQAAISPVLPHNPERFASLLADAADRVVVDTYVSGDGAEGARTQRRPLPGAYNRLQWGDWRDESSARSLHAILQQRLMPDRVFWSRDGFNSLPSALQMSLDADPARTGSPQAG